MHRFIPISNGVGHTLLAGQQDDPYEKGHAFPEMYLRLKYEDLPFPERETKVEDEALREALHFMFSHPGYEVQLAFEKLYHLYEDDSGALQWIRAPAAPLGEEWQIDPSIIPPSARQEEPPVYIPPSAEGWWSRLADGYYYVVLAAAVFGAPLWFSLRDRKRLLLVLLVVGWTAVHLLFMPRPRYHAPLLPVFSLWAAVALVASWDRLVAAIKAEPRSDRI